jgi:predicted DsbA family dithiol-disulfide isomerase
MHFSNRLLVMNVVANGVSYNPTFILDRYFRIDGWLSKSGILYIILYVMVAKQPGKLIEQA